jgi:glycosyltransferase involved in cell wall biosynthesis
MSPAVSVIMAVRNGVPWISEAVASVLGQTLADLELIVVDDGSTDATGAALAVFDDRRLRVVRQAPAGLTTSLNRALRLARAPLVARLDADDTARPDRLRRQAALFASRPALGVVGTGAVEVDVGGRPVRTVVPPEDDAAIRRMLIRANPFVHSSVMFRRAVVDRAGGYDERLAVAQDYDLWLRLAPSTVFANIADALVVRRLLPERVSVVRDADRLRTEVRARWRAVRCGAYPWWAAAWAVRSALALAAPPPLRRAWRRAAGRVG